MNTLFDKIIHVIVVLLFLVLIAFIALPIIDTYCEMFSGR